MLRISFSLIFVLILFCSMLSFAQTKKIVNGSQDCGPGRHFVRAHPRNPTVRADGVAVSGSYVDAHCQDNVKGYSFWNPKLNDNRPKEWPLPSEKTKKWSVAEQELMFEALSRVPEVLWPKNLNIFRMDRSKDHPNPT